MYHSKAPNKRITKMLFQQQESVCTFIEVPSALLL